MTPAARDVVIRHIRDCRAEAVLKAAAMCDGHAILEPRALLAAGLPGEVVDHLTRTHRSDGTFKGTIFVAGRRVEALRGIAGLDALRLFAAALDVPFRRALGRESEAANIRAALARYLSQRPGTPAGVAHAPPADGDPPPDAPNTLDVS